MEQTFYFRPSERTAERSGAVIFLTGTFQYSKQYLIFQNIYILQNKIKTAPGGEINRLGEY